MVVSHILLVYREHREYIYIYLETIVVVSHILLVYSEHGEYIYILGDYSGGFSYTPGI